MVINAMVAAAVIGVGFFIRAIPQQPIYGKMNARATSMATAEKIAFLMAIIAGTVVVVVR